MIFFCHKVNFVIVQKKLLLFILLNYVHGSAVLMDKVQDKCQLSKEAFMKKCYKLSLKKLFAIFAFTIYFFNVNAESEALKDKAIIEINNEYLNYRVEFAKKNNVDFNILPKEVPKELLYSINNMSDDRLSIYFMNKNESSKVFKKYIKKVFQKKVRDFLRNVDKESLDKSVLPNVRSNVNKASERNSKNFKKESLVFVDKYFNFFVSAIVTIIVVLTSLVIRKVFARKEYEK